MYRKRNQLMELAVCAIDMLVNCFSLLFAGLLRYHDFERVFHAENLQETLAVMLVIHVAVYYFLKIYDGFFRRGRYKELAISLEYNLVLVAGVAFISFSMKRELFVSRLVMGYFFVINTLLLWIVHILIRNGISAYRMSRHKMTNVLLVTTRDRLKETKEQFERSKEVSWNIVGAVLIGEQNTPETIYDIPVISDTEDAYLDFTTLNVVDEVFIQLNDLQTNESLIRRMILEFEQMGIVVNLDLDEFDLDISGEKHIGTLEGYNVVSYSGQNSNFFKRALKRIFG